MRYGSFFTSNSIKHGDIMKEIGCYKATPQRTWMKRAIEILLNYLLNCLKVAISEMFSWVSVIRHYV